MWVSLWRERRRQSNYRKHPGSDTSDTVPRDRRNPILFRIEGSLTSGSIWTRLSYSVFPVTSNTPIPYSWQVSWIRPGHQSTARKEISVAHMKTITRSKIHLAMAAIILAATLVVPAAAQHLVPFKGALQGNDIDGVFNFPILPVFTDGTGTGTHLGEFSYHQQSALNIVTRTATGSTQWIAANGDTIQTTSTGLGGPTDAPPVCSGLGEVIIGITEIHTIIGGTGRFAGAQGSFKVERQASPVTFKTCGSFQGSITSPGAAH